MAKELHEKLKKLNAEMTALNGPRYKHVYATHDGARFEIRISRAADGGFNATTLQRVGTYLITGHGRLPSDAFTAITQSIEWSLRRSTQEMLEQRRREAAASRFQPVAA